VPRLLDELAIAARELALGDVLGPELADAASRMFAEWLHLLEP
jgi:hypothetical protein